MDASEPVLRVAVAADVPELEALMKASIRDIFPSFYDAVQTASSVIHVGHVDRMLIADGTYFAVEAGGAIVACGGWSRRDKLFTGSADQEGRARLLDPAIEPARVRAMFVRGDWTRRGLGTRILDACEAAARAEGYRTLALMATLPGIPLYERFGFRILERTHITLPDGRAYACEVLDISLSGAALRIAVLPCLGTCVSLGKMRGRVVRFHECGIAIEFLKLLERTTFAGAATGNI